MKKFSKAIASEDPQEILNLIKNGENIDIELIDQLLEDIESPETKELIKNEFSKRMEKSNSFKSNAITDETVENRILSEVDIEEDMRTKKGSLNKSSKDSLKETTHQEHAGENTVNSSDLYENISEEDALKKYKFGNSKYDKALEMFINSFKANIENVNFDKAGKLSKLIVEHIISEYLNTFPKEVRSKSHNLKENAKLCMNVYYESLDSADFVKMSVEEMQSEDLKSKDSEYIKNSLLASQLAKSAAETDIFKCSKCKQNKCVYSQLQTRSCDEPMTTFVTCTVCGHVWKF